MRLRSSAFRAFLMASAATIPVAGEAQGVSSVSTAGAQPPPPASVASAAEPVTREYERYAQNTVRPLASNAGGSGYAPLGSPDSTGGSALSSPYGLLTTPPSANDRAPVLDPAPVQTVQVGVSPAFDINSNPFGSTSSPMLDEPGTPSNTGQRRGSSPAPATTDALTADIDRSIEQVSADVAPRFDAAVSLRGRSGDEGLGHLYDVEAPLEASFSPAGYGRLKVQVTPVYLDAGKQSTTSRAIFGTNPLVSANGVVGPASRTTTASGVGLDVGYSYGIVSGDIGSTPFGFLEQNVIGGVQFAPKLAENMTLRLTAERRAVTDSLLSYAGMKDARTGEKFGGVTRNRLYAQLDGSVGNIYYYAGAGGGFLLGEQVKSNTEIEAGAGFSVPVWTTATQEVRVGTSLVWLSYAKNLDNFTLGSGGYFSPQQYFAALFPVTYKQQVTPDLSYLLGGTIGVQTFRAKSVDVFREDPALQAQLVSFASANPGVPTQFGGYNETGVAGGARAEVDYRVNDNLHVGARAGFDRSGNFTEGTGLVYARYVFNDPPPK